MALINCDFSSASLGEMTSIRVIIPENSEAKAPYPVLYLLHGLSDDQTAWTRRTSIERYVQEMNLAVVMPRGGRSFYCDMAEGGRYFTYISEELPKKLQAMFKLSAEREDTFIAGLSMGGYGALKFALRNPERFAAAASLSGVLNVAEHEWFEGKNELHRVFGDLDKLKGSENDLFQLVSDLKTGGKTIPELFIVCGTEDFLYQHNVQFKKHLATLEVPFTYHEEPGTHCWNFWDKWIQEVLSWLPLKKV